MSRPVWLVKVAFGLSLLALGACAESTAPTQPEAPASQASAAVGYVAHDMEIIYRGEGGGANSINTAGVVVGSSFGPDDTWRAWIWKNGTAALLGTLGGRESWANDINDLGQVVGYSQTSFDKLRAFRWQNGVMKNLGSLGGRDSRATAINNNGQIVGTSELTGNPRDSRGNRIRHAFLLKNGVMTDLGTLGGANSAALDINDAGQIVGWAQTAVGIAHPVLWQNGVIKDLLPPGSAGVVGGANAINPFGVIVGESDRRAFRYSAGVLRMLPLGSTAPSSATGIRNGRIVGTLTTPNGSRGFVLADGQLTLLPLLDPEDDAEEDNFASDINGKGVIVGTTSLYDSNQPPTMWTPQ